MPDGMPTPCSPDTLLRRPDRVPHPARNLTRRRPQRAPPGSESIPLMMEERRSSGSAHSTPCDPQNHAVQNTRSGTMTTHLRVLARLHKLERLVKSAVWDRRLGCPHLSLAPPDQSGSAGKPAMSSQARRVFVKTATCPNVVRPQNHEPSGVQ